MRIHSRELAEHKECRGEAFSLSIECEEKKIVYSSDILGLDDIAPICEGGGDILICEATHIDPEDLPEFTKAHPFRRLVLTHIPDDIEDDALDCKTGYLRAKDGLMVAF